MAVGAAAGQIAGGVLVSADLFGAGRRPVFLVNVPIGALLLAAGPRLISGTGRPVRRVAWICRAWSCSRGRWYW